MIFNSFQFLWLFPLIFVVYYSLQILLPYDKEKVNKITNYSLIVISYGLYVQYKPAYALLLLGVTVVTYFFAIKIEKENSYFKKKNIILVGGILTLLPLGIFKYYNFINTSFANFFSYFGISTSIPGLNIAVPLGISFFTFQAIGYLFDVYYKRINAEHNWWDYMLFVCFFPQLLSGPISKARDLLPQIKAVRTFDYNQAVEGLKWLLWGMFIKVVLADRLGLYVSSIYDNYEAYSGISCFVASVFYSFQIYGDFAGYSFMALGVGKLLGFNLINNFNHPYLSISVTDFWRRWHISLSTWLKDYVYIPLGGNRCSKLRNYFNIIVTFLVSGIWHGANWTFIVWGLMHGIFQVIEKAFNMQKCENRHLFIRLPRIIITFLFVNFAWIFFRMADLKSGWALFERIFTVGGSLSIPSGIDAIMQMTPLIIVVVSELLSEFSKRRITLINNGNSVVRWLTYVFLFLYILLFGVLDSSQFIYANF